MSIKFQHKWSVQNFTHLYLPQDTPTIQTESVHLQRGRPAPTDATDFAKYRFLCSPNFGLYPGDRRDEARVLPGQTGKSEGLNAYLELCPFGFNDDSDGISLFINFRNFFSRPLVLRVKVSILGANGPNEYFKEVPQITVNLCRRIEWPRFMKNTLFNSNLAVNLVNGHLTLLTEVEILNYAQLPIVLNKLTNSETSEFSAKQRVLQACAHKWIIPQFREFFANPRSKRINSPNFYHHSDFSLQFSLCLGFQEPLSDGEEHLGFIFNVISECAQPEKRVFFRVSLLNGKGENVFSLGAFRKIYQRNPANKPWVWPIVSRQLQLKRTDHLHQALLQDELTVYCEIWVIEYPVKRKIPPKAAQPKAAQPKAPSPRVAPPPPQPSPALPDLLQGHDASREKGQPEINLAGANLTNTVVNIHSTASLRDFTAQTGAAASSVASPVEQAAKLAPAPASTIDYTWRIGNFPFLCNDASHETTPEWSDTFGSPSIAGLKFYLQLKPQFPLEGKKYVALYLYLEASPKREIDVNVKLSIVSATGTLENTRRKSASKLKQGKKVSFEKYAVNYYLLSNSSVLLPNETLTLRCQIELRGQ